MAYLIVGEIGAGAVTALIIGAVLIDAGHAVGGVVLIALGIFGLYAFWKIIHETNKLYDELEREMRGEAKQRQPDDEPGA